MEQKTTAMQPRPTPKHKLSAIMFTDMTGFSRKMGESERLTLKLLRDHNRIIRFLVRKHHGQIIKSTGDGFLMDFDSAVEAVQCALEAFVAGKSTPADLRDASMFEESPEEHQRRVHPDLEVTRKRWRELERLFAEKMGGQMIYPDDN